MRKNSRIHNGQLMMLFSMFIVIWRKKTNWHEYTCFSMLKSLDSENTLQLELSHEWETFSTVSGNTTDVSEFLLP